MGNKNKKVQFLQVLKDENLQITEAAVPFCIEIFLTGQCTNRLKKLDDHIFCFI